jgi:hypothetical protein
MRNEFFRPIDSDYMEWDLRWLRRQSQKAVALGTELGVENKTDAEIRKETDELVMAALLTAIRRYESGYEIGALDTPEILYQYLWRLLYEDEAKRSDMMDVTEETKERLQDELEKVADFIDHEYDRRLYEFEKMEEHQ